MDCKLLYILLIFFSTSVTGQTWMIENFLKSKTQLNFTEIIARDGTHGYEEHSVTTEDGYILKVFRLIPPKSCSGKMRKPPVFLMHGLLLNADAWIVSGPSSGLGYLISDLCFDLWIGNVRGNSYSRNHVSLDPDTDKDFWEYAYTELGAVDLPAVIDYILDKTNSEKVNYAGYSQGGGTFYVMCSERPEYCKKVGVVIAMAPATRLINARSWLLRLIGTVSRFLRDTLKLTIIREIAPKGSAIQTFLALVCPLNTFLCDLAKDSVDYVHSLHPGFIAKSTLKVMFKTFPAGTSLKNWAHVGQLLTSDEFRKYDYGSTKNMEIYGTVEPPPYNFSAVTTPSVLIYGLNDGLIDPEDSIWLSKQLPNLIDLHPVSDSRWNHFDVIYSKYTKELLLPKVRQYLLQYSSLA